MSWARRELGVRWARLDKLQWEWLRSTNFPVASLLRHVFDIEFVSQGTPPSRFGSKGWRVPVDEWNRMCRLGRRYTWTAGHTKS